MLRVFIFDFAIKISFQIFILFDILGHKTSTTIPLYTNDKRTLLDVDSSSTKSGRRPSLETISTYLSQESRESRATASTSDLINCGGSDDGLEEQPTIIGTFIQFHIKWFYFAILQDLGKFLLSYLLITSRTLHEIFNHFWCTSFMR